MTEPYAHVTAYSVGVLPEDDVNHHVYAITVEYRGNGRWAIVHLGSCLGTDGTWAAGVKPYDRGDDWLRTHRFTEDEAIRLAKATAPHIVVNGISATEALRRRIKP